MRGILTGAVLLAGLLAGCSGSDGASAPAPQIDQETLRNIVNAHSPYAGSWAIDSSNCDEPKKLWTIEARRMGIRAERFCAFRSIYQSQAADTGDESVWSAAADCLAEGQETKEFVFFRLKNNLREMRVTFNDNRPTQLVRCAPTKS